MNTIEIIADHLTSLGLRFRVADEQTIAIGFTGDNTTYEATIRPRGNLVSVVVHMVAVVPRPRLNEAIRVANLLNATRISYGCFWVDPDRSRLAFELAIGAPDGVTREQMGLAMAALSQIDDSFPALARVLWGGETAAAALMPRPASEAEAIDEDDDAPPLDMAV